MGLGQVPLQGGRGAPLLQEHHRVLRLAGEVVVVAEAAVLGADGLLDAAAFDRLDESGGLARLAGVGDV